MNKFFKGIFSSESGSVMPIFGMSIVVLMTTAGMALDVTRVMNEKQQAQNSVDAAALMVAGEISRFNDKTMSDLYGELSENAFIISGPLLEKARGTFAANFPSDDSKNVKMDININPVNERKFEIISVATGETGTTFMQLAQKKEMEWRVEARTTVEVPSIELTVVADISASMRNQDIAAMKRSLSILVDSLYSDGRSNSLRKMSLVPFSDSVNFGANYKAHWLSQIRPGVYAPQAYAKDFEGCFRPEFNPKKKEIDFGYTSPGAYSALKNSYSGRIPYCPKDSSRVELFGSDPKVLKARISGLTKGYGTGTGVATMWGVRTLTPDWRGKFLEDDQYPKNFSENTQKYLIIMTDGQPIQIDPEGDGSNTGIRNSGARLKIAAESFVDACNAAKAQPGTIHVYTIAYRFGSVSKASKQDLADCVNGDGKFFQANEQTIEKVFKEIGNDVSRVKLSS